ncbi:ibr domain containing protein [Stylonychia lemnae]|uniref:RBR-type E3 ubiquitin transferase n=1 Tax=Stylonychia lemnae TaxID=5949 RepID=A0A078ABD3_STYLE|nr:ibr domain containing protein [Stylonychia lemnae]|eukprot:CDW78103.1 ibr domain containing protein [Stylonychia lemnae]
MNEPDEKYEILPMDENLAETMRQNFLVFKPKEEPIKENNKNIISQTIDLEEQKLIQNVSYYDLESQELKQLIKPSDAIQRCNLQKQGSSSEYSSFEVSAREIQRKKKTRDLDCIKQGRVRDKLLDQLVDKKYFSDVDADRTGKCKPNSDQKQANRLKSHFQNQVSPLKRDIERQKQNLYLENKASMLIVYQQKYWPIIQNKNTAPLHKENKLIRNIQVEEKLYCEICYKPIENDSQLLSLNCGHSYCKECLEAMVLYAIDVSGEVNKLKCPDSKCTAVLSRNVIQNLTNSEKFQKYLGFMLNYELILDKNKKFCPSPDCHNILERKGLGFSSKIKCEKCNNEICFDCQAVWHQGQSCRQFQNNTTVGWILKKDAQKCPKCKVLIEKNDGCIHMKCYKCQHYFCWGCGFPVDHIIHNKDIQQFLVYGICIGDKYKSVSFRKLVFIYLLLSFGAQFISFLLILIGAALFWIVGPFSLYNDITDSLKGPIIKTIVIYLLVFAYPACICLGLISSVLFAAVYLGLAFLPLMILHSYYLISIIRWWKQGRAFKGL